MHKGFNTILRIFFYKYKTIPETYISGRNNVNFTVGHFDLMPSRGRHERNLFKPLLGSLDWLKQHPTIFSS